jgi:hypothetical protein
MTMTYTPVVPYITHVRQRYDARGRVWRATIDGKDWDWSNCAHACACAAIERATLGRVRTVDASRDTLGGDPPPLSPRAHRNESGDLDKRNPGSTERDLARAAETWGVHLDVLVGKPWSWFEALVVGQSRSAVLMTSFARWPDGKSCQPGFEGKHAVLWHMQCDHPRRSEAEHDARSRHIVIPPHDCTNGRHALISDPLCPAPKWLAIDDVRPALLAYGDGRVYAALTDPDPEDVPAMDQARIGRVGDIAVGTPYYSSPARAAQDRPAGVISAAHVAAHPDGFAYIARSGDGQWVATAPFVDSTVVRWVHTSKLTNRRYFHREVEVPVADPALIEAQVNERLAVALATERVQLREAVHTAVEEALGR